MVCTRHLLALFLWLVLSGFQEEKRENVCAYVTCVRVGENLLSSDFCFYFLRWLASKVPFESLIVLVLSFDAAVLLSRVTGALSRHVLIYSNMNYRFVMISSLTFKMQVCV